MEREGAMGVPSVFDLCRSAFPRLLSLVFITSHRNLTWLNQLCSDSASPIHNTPSLRDVTLPTSSTCIFCHCAKPPPYRASQGVSVFCLLFFALLRFFFSSFCSSLLLPFSTSLLHPTHRRLHCPFTWYFIASQYSWPMRKWVQYTDRPAITPVIVSVSTFHFHSRSLSKILSTFYFYPFSTCPCYLLLFAFLFPLLPLGPWLTRSHHNACSSVFSLLHRTPPLHVPLSLVLVSLLNTYSLSLLALLSVNSNSYMKTLSLLSRQSRHRHFGFWSWSSSLSFSFSTTTSIDYPYLSRHTSYRHYRLSINTNVDDINHTSHIQWPQDRKSVV